MYKLIHKVIAVRKNVYHWRIVPTLACLECAEVETVLHAVSLPQTQTFIENIEPIFQKLFGKHFKLNLYKIVFVITYKGGNNASKLGNFLWSKVIKTIWICRKLLEESKSCDEMAIFKRFVKNQIETEYFVALEQLERRGKFLIYWYLKTSLQLTQMPSN